MASEKSKPRGEQGRETTPGCSLFSSVSALLWPFSCSPGSYLELGCGCNPEQSLQQFPLLFLHKVPPKKDVLALHCFETDDPNLGTLVQVAQPVNLQLDTIRYNYFSLLIMVCIPLIQVSIQIPIHFLIGKASCEILIGSRNNKEQWLKIPWVGLSDPCGSLLTLDILWF